jgi:acyl-CoA thioester hydrolase
MMLWMAAFTWITRVRYVDTDTSGRIHYTALFRYFEAAEQEFLRWLGHSYPRIDAGETGWPRVHVECDISGALEFDDEIGVEVTVSSVGNSSMDLSYRILKDGTECSTGRVVVVCMDRRTQRSKRLPEAFAAALRGQMSVQGQ